MLGFFFFAIFQKMVWPIGWCQHSNAFFPENFLDHFSSFLWPFGNPFRNNIYHIKFQKVGIDSFSFSSEKLGTVLNPLGCFLHFSLLFLFFWSQEDLKLCRQKMHCLQLLMWHTVLYFSLRVKAKVLTGESG